MLKFLRYILFPISLLYGVVMACRNVLFNIGWFKSDHFDFPIISIGNITVGGTGKTPHTEYMVALLRGVNKLAILSRGYGRKTSGFRIVEVDSKVEQCGDEPCQMKRNYPRQIVAVDEDRRRGIITLKEGLNPDVVFLDDAYQHRWVNPGLSILLVDYSRPIFNDFMLPTGNLREFPQGSKRADVIVVTKCPEAISVAEREYFAQKLKLKTTQKLFFSTYCYEELRLVFSDEEHCVDLKGAVVLLLSGIANPKPLKTYLQNSGAELTMMTFTDHHQYTNQELIKVAEVFEQLPEEKRCIITTEKDAIRLRSGVEVPKVLKSHLYYMPIKVRVLDNQEEFDQLIKDYVGKN